MLALILTRARFAPLDLLINQPVSLVTLEPLTLHKGPIYSLILEYDNTLISVPTNMSALQRLCLIGSTYDQIKEAMDLALTSTNQDLALEIVPSQLLKASLRSHELLGRTKNLLIWSGQCTQPQTIDLSNSETLHSFRATDCIQ
jgi:hypothetical protein